jgi:hypothetical protein
MSKAKPLYMETTEISAERTAGEITSILVAAGARQISMDYGDGGKVTGMRFVLLVGGYPHLFKMPVRTEVMQKIFKDRRIQTMKWRAGDFEQKDREQAERVAWRQLLKWIQAQLAMVDAGMAQAREVFAPYLLDESGQRTLFEYLEETRYKCLPPGKEA